MWLYFQLGSKMKRSVTSSGWGPLMPAQLPFNRPHCLWSSSGWLSDAPQARLSTCRFPFTLVGPSYKDAASFISHFAPPCPQWDDKRWSLRSEKAGGSNATVPSKGEDATSLDDSNGTLICECCLPLLGEITGCSGGCVCCDVALSDLTSVAEEVSWPTDLLRCVSVSAMLCFFKALLNFCILSDGASVFCFSFGQFPLELLKKQTNKNSDRTQD